MVENLISDLLQEGIGQISHCPVILVGHSVGGLIIKQLCSEAHHWLHKKQGFNKDRLEVFLKNIRGIFFYATPHHGSFPTQQLADIIGDPLLRYVKTFSKDTDRLDYKFKATRRVYKWPLAGLGETLPTKLGPGRSLMITTEASARGDDFRMAEDADHISICKAPDKITRIFGKLKGFLLDIAKSMEEEVKIFEDRAKQEAKESHQIHGLPDHPVELVTRSQDVLKILQGGAVLGIWGMGGIGKTTLAKQVFNTISRDFEYTCFINDVKITNFNELENRLLADVHQRGMRLPKIQWSSLRNMKTLIVMDDIDAEKQLEFLPKFHYFGKGSCLIMTSRNKELFNFYEECVVYEVGFLEQADAIKLFCQNAFSSTEIPTLLQELIMKVVRKCDGLPLTLEVMGRYLWDQTTDTDHTPDTEVWEQALEKLGNAQSITGVQNDRVWASLQASYDTLSKEEQQMFIEAATIFFNSPLDKVHAGWSSITGQAKTTWRNLVSRSLVREVNRMFWTQLGDEKQKVVWVHEQLRDLAKTIEPGGLLKGRDEDADLLVDKINTNIVKDQPIRLDLDYWPSYVQRKTLQLNKLAKMERLKYMELSGVSSESRGKGLPTNLYILRWTECVESRHHTPRRLHTFPINLNEIRNLAVLELQGVVVPKKSAEALGNLANLRFLLLDDVEGLDRLQENIGNLSLLKELTVKNVRSLTLPESFGNLKALERLAFKDIKGFVRLPETFGNLSMLKELTVEKVASFKLPESFGNLKALERLAFKYIMEFGRLPETFGNLSMLKVLKVENVASFKLPESFGNLKALEQLAFEYIKGLDHLPKTFGNLSSLKDLSIVNCPMIKYLPQSFSRLSKLQRLSTCWGLEELGDFFSDLSSLRQLRLQWVEVQALPASIWRLPALQELELISNKLKTLSGNICQLTHLVKLTIRADELDTLPENLYLLESLRKLEIHCPKLERLPERLGDPALLEFLELFVSVKALPESVGKLSSLKTLKLHCKNLEKLPDSFVELSSMEELTISPRNSECLPKSIGRLQSLRKLTVNVTSLPKSIGQSLSSREFEGQSLSSLCSGHEETSNLFKNLSSFAHKLVLDGSWDFQRSKLPASLSSLSSVRDLTIKYIENLERLREELGELRSLERLSIESCGDLKSLPDSLGRISSLQELNLANCWYLESLPDSLGNPSLPELASAQGDRSNQLKTQEEESSQTKGTQGMQLRIRACGFLDDSVLKSLGWTFMSEDRRGKCYQRKQTR